ncbi:MAG: hypothetical protein E7Z63_06150 [Thermoplasmata archaeon]|nr:hypothetical protein [Thermoplasmata archaeon]
MVDQMTDGWHTSQKKWDVLILGGRVAKIRCHDTLVPCRLWVKDWRSGYSDGYSPIDLDTTLITGQTLFTALYRSIKSHRYIIRPIEGAEPEVS